MADISTYAGLTQDERGHSSWFLARTNKEHQATMNHPFMKAIYDQSFRVEAYIAYLCSQYLIFSELERLCTPQRNARPLAAVYDEALHRSPALIADLVHWCKSTSQLEKPVPSPATAAYLEKLRGDAGDHWLLLCHHFLNYNAILSGGQFLGRMVSARGGAEPPKGVEFFTFPPECEPIHDRVLQYIERVDELQIPDPLRARMLECMKAIYVLHLGLFDEHHATTAPSSVAATSGMEASKPGAGRKNPIPPPLEPSQRKIRFSELQQHGGMEAATLGVPLLTSVLGRVYDVSSAKDLFGAGAPYDMFTGHDGTYNLAVMSLKKTTLDKFQYEIDDDEKICLADWIAYFDRKFGRPIGLLSDRGHPLELAEMPSASKIPFEEDDEDWVEGEAGSRIAVVVPEGSHALPASKL